MKIKQNYMWYTFSSDEIASFGNLLSNELFILNEELKIRLNNWNYQTE